LGEDESIREELLEEGKKFHGVNNGKEVNRVCGLMMGRRAMRIISYRFTGNR
jgi:hypothetical protein